jgi:hypothetical protein
VVRVRSGDKWAMHVVPGAEPQWRTSIEPKARPEEVAVSAVTRLGKEGPITRVSLSESKN